ncbi:hypothetical protein M011DRAFT_125952 [Sporormia fimetaria CBS 119925]|uniref:Uncharacterized protein n=1 Tax=Sporormia fimetaria CBS 119925 TaxID=1340428 RepID=A0A6A6V8N7_9PLEO|nr:hypothetical protein M011DRAFT_125952 [Sporormia fimetaria CBS 119925]
MPDFNRNHIRCVFCSAALSHTARQKCSPASQAQEIVDYALGPRNVTEVQLTSVVLRPVANHDRINAWAALKEIVLDNKPMKVPMVRKERKRTMPMLPFEFSSTETTHDPLRWHGMANVRKPYGSPIEILLKETPLKPDLTTFQASQSLDSPE